MGQAKQMFTQQRDEEQQIKQGLTINEKNFLTLDKQSVTELAMAVVDKYTDGHNNPVEGLLLAKKLIDLGEEIKDNLGDYPTNELKLANKEKRVVLGATFNEQMVGVRWSYKDCGDPVWNELNTKLKEREAFLQTIKGRKQELIEETGEVVEISEPVKSGKLGLIIKY